ncbi:MAG: response regulator [Bryobacteraceae bacterium]
MPIPLRVLVVSDSESDAFQLIEELRKSDYVPSFDRVSAAGAFRDSLNQKWDLVIAEYENSQLSARDALEILHEAAADIPFVTVSDGVPEEIVLAMLKAGASGFVTRDHLSWLGATVARGLSLAEGRRDRARLEQQFRQAQKMEAVGRLAGGVAHDFNNLLTVITGYADLLLSAGHLETSQRTALEEIRRAAERGGALTHQLLAFSRRQPFTPKVVPLNTLILNMQKMLSRLIGEDIELITVAAAEPANTRTDPGQLEQVIMNIVVNARDAMPGGGKLIIETSTVVVDETYGGTNVDLRPGSYVVLAISDTGMGMDQETTSHLFEPFFTTKAPGKGTGLGLATAYGIVKQSGGAISIYSEPGTGTTVKIYLPSAEAKDPAEADAKKLKGSLRGTETILVVEDEARVRKLICEVLVARGYHVLEAVRGEEAIRIVSKYKGRIHLLLADVVMPEMSGPRAVERIKDLQPGIRVLYMSGYTDEAIVHHGILESGQPFLQKPFLPDTLASKVREVLSPQASAC